MVDHLARVGDGHPLAPDAALVAALPARLAGSSVTGGATCDALVGATAAGSAAALLTLDVRAARTCAAVGAQHRLVA